MQFSQYTTDQQHWSPPKGKMPYSTAQAILTDRLLQAWQGILELRLRRSAVDVAEAQEMVLHYTMQKDIFLLTPSPATCQMGT